MGSSPELLPPGPRRLPGTRSLCRFSRDACGIARSSMGQTARGREFHDVVKGEPIMESSLAFSGSMPVRIKPDRRPLCLVAVFALAAALRAWLASADLPFYLETDEAILLYQTGILGL